MEFNMTLKDIAEMAGVSTMTVSNVINGKTSRVSQKTRDKINSIIEEYNYVPNMNARSLSNNSSHIIGVVIFLEDKDYASGYNYFVKLCLYRTNHCTDIWVLKIIVS